MSNISVFQDMINNKSPLPVKSVNTNSNNYVPVFSDYTAEGVEEYNDQVEDAASKYLNFITSEHKEKILALIPQHNENLSSDYKGTFFEGMNCISSSVFAFLSGIFLGIPMTIYVIYSIVISSETSFPMLVALCLLASVHVANVSIIKNKSAYVKFLIKTNYQINVIDIIKKYKSRTIAITEQSLYHSFYDKDKNEFSYAKYNFSDIRYIKIFKTTGGKKVIQPFNHKDEELFHITCQNDGEYNLLYACIKRKNIVIV